MAGEDTLPDVISMILGSLISGLVGVLTAILIERYRRRLESRNEHFKDIKTRCLEPILEELSSLKQNFELGESRPPPRTLKIEELLKSEISWWKYYSLARRVDSLLYEDLPNHYKDLASKLEEVQKLIPIEYPKFLKAVKDLSEKIENDIEFIEFKKDFETPVIIETSAYPFYGVFFSSLELDKGIWPNIYNYLEKRKDKLSRLGNKFRDTEEAKRLREIQTTMLNKIELIVREVESILLETKLSGRCKYIN